MRTSPRLVVLALSLVLGCISQVAEAQPLVVEAKTSKGKTLLTFKVSVVPADPFHEANAVGAKDPVVKGFQRGDSFLLVIEGTPAPKFHTYPLTKKAADQDPTSLCKLTFSRSSTLIPVFGPEESEPHPYDTKVTGIWLAHEKSFTWTQQIFISPEAKPGEDTVNFQAKTQLCDDQGCTWLTTNFAVPVTILNEPAMEPSPRIKAWLEAQSKQPATTTPETTASPGTPTNTNDWNGLFGFALQGIFWGAVSLITPCVFPMIPITVSFFLKQAETKKHSALKLATIYTLTVVIVLTIAAVALLSAFRWLSTWWVMNGFLGLLFIYFALSLFGLYDIELPGWLSAYTSSREGQGGIVGTVFMALTFTIISFACVAPFLGGFGGTASGSGLTFWHRLAGGFAFAATFAAPFFVLALFPSLMKSLPRSGAWMNSVKVVMGFLELAAALKFFRQAEVKIHDPIFFTYELVLSAYIALCLLCALYLLGVYRLHHDSATNEISVGGLLVGFLFLGLGLHLAPGLIKTYNPQGQRTYPNSEVFAWVDSFMLPDTSSEPAPPAHAGVPEEKWLANLKKALDESEKSGKPIFVDFTGVTCTNCKYNERTYFSRPDVRELFSKYVLVQLYTDRIPNQFYHPSDMDRATTDTEADGQRNLDFQKEIFNDEQLPLYLVLRPDGPRQGSFHGTPWLPESGFKLIARYNEGKINNLAAFKEFLAKNAAN